MQNVYICHQYYEPSHFKALYDCAHNYGYHVNELVVLNPKSAILHREELIEKEGEEIADEWYRNNFINQGKLWLLRNEIVIIGVAPYDRLLAQYQGVLAQNYSIYMTSCTEWHSGKVPYPYEDNKASFFDTLSNYIDGVACVSATTQQEVSFWNNVTQVVNHAIKVEEYVKKKEYKRRKKYIFIGRLVDVKNTILITDYLKRFSENDIEIDIAGDGPLRNVLENYARLDRRFHLLGYLSKAEIKQQLHEYDFLILPSYFEPFGIVLLEALACGVPCIISNLAGPMEVITHDETGIVFPLEEVDGFVKAINYSMELQDHQYESMCRKAISKSKQYDVNEIAKKWVLLFQTICKTRVKK